MADDRLTINAGINSDAVESGMDDITGKIKQGMSIIKDYAGNGMESFKNSVLSAVNASTLAIAGLGKTAFDSVKGMVSAGDEYNKAMNQLSASTGATGEELSGLEDVVQGVYNNNFGESWDDVANTVAEIKKQTGLMGDELQAASEGAFALSDTFDMDVSESTRAVSSLMKNFGISAEEAYNLIAMGAQNGANQNDDLLDTLNEYSAQYSALGLSADEFMQSLISGADAGVFSIDKVGDAVKEFNIRAKDGSDSSAEGFNLLGMNAEAMTAKFAQGGDTAQKAFYQVVNALESMDDPVAKNTAAVDLFGTMYEDLESNMLPILSSMQNAGENTYDALGQINEVKYNDIGSAVEGLKRAVGSFSIDVKSELAGGIAGALGGLVTAINSFDGDYSKLVQGIVQAGKDMISAFSPLISGFKEKAVLIISAIGDGIKEKMPFITEKAGDIVKDLALGFLESRQKLIEVAVPLITAFAEGISQNISGLADAAMGIINGLIDSVQMLLPSLIPCALNIILALINGILGALPTLISFVPTIIFTIVNTLLTNLPIIFDAALQIIMTIVTGLVENVSILLSAAITVLMTLIDMITENLPMLIDITLQIVMTLVNGILQNCPAIIEASVQMLLELIAGIIDSLPLLLDCAAQMIDSLVSAVAENFPTIISCAADLMIQLANGLIQAIPKITACIPQIVKAIWNAITSVDWLDLGVNILKGIADGLIAGLSSIGDTISDVADGIVESFKNFFGIHSPSTLFRDEIGSYLPRGLAVGVDAEMNTTADDINSSLNSMMSGIDIDGLYAQMSTLSPPYIPTADYDIKGQVYKSQLDDNADNPGNYPNSTNSAADSGNWTFPIYLFPNSDALDSIIVSAAARANIVSGGRSI